MEAGKDLEVISGVCIRVFNIDLFNNKLIFLSKKSKSRAVIEILYSEGI